MEIGLGNVAVVGDPRRPSLPKATEVDASTGAGMGTAKKLHDKNVTFEEYLHFASISRSDDRYKDQNRDYVLFGRTLKKGSGGGQLAGITDETLGEKTHGGERMDGAYPGSRRVSVPENEYIQASRALRTASWLVVFYLITTDILGPYSAPWAFAALGYGPGVTVYTVFGALAAYGGILLWKMYLALDSDRYPLRTYSDLSFRIYGPGFRQITNILQNFQLFFNVGIIIVQNGQSLEQIITGAGLPSFCFILLCLFFTLAGMVLGQIRTLRNLGWLANSTIWINVFIMFVVMVVSKTGGILADAAAAQNTASLGTETSQPVETTAGTRPGVGFITSVNGLQQAIFSYGGATLFVEFMAEMRNPFDFWKGMIFAQVFIFFFYMLFGLVVYSFQGQFVINPAYQTIAPYGWQTATNILGIIASLIAALLYGNIGVKVIYNSLLMDLFRFPDLGTRAGKLVWVAFVPCYWGLAFVIASAIPQVTNLSALVAAVSILQFSYTFPPLLMLGYRVKKDAMVSGDGFDPATGQTVRSDGFMERLVRGYMKRPVFNTWNVVYFLGCLVLCVIGIYSAVTAMQAAYSVGVSSSFSCKNPFATA